jgi:hypothetical protein
VLDQRGIEITHSDVEFRRGDVTYLDPLDEGLGLDGLAIVLRGESVQQTRGGVGGDANDHSIGREGEYESTMISGDGAEVAEGVDCGESGAKANVELFPVEWVIELQDRCLGKGVADFLKQLGRRPSRRGNSFQLRHQHSGDWSEWTPDLWGRRCRTPKQTSPASKSSASSNSSPTPTTRRRRFAAAQAKESGFDELTNLIPAWRHAPLVRLSGRDASGERFPDARSPVA